MDNTDYITRYIPIEENGIHIVFGITREQQFKLLHFSRAEFDPDTLVHTEPECNPYDASAARRQDFLREAYPLVQVNYAGYDRPYERHGNKYIVTAPGYLLTFVGMEDIRNKTGRLLVITQADHKVTGAVVETRMQFYDGTSAVRITHTVTNHGSKAQTLEYLSSFFLSGIDKEGEEISDSKMHVLIPYNGWQKELNVQDFSFREIGLAQSDPFVAQRTSSVFAVTNTGNASTKCYLPWGYIGNKEADTALFFQIEHNGSWHYEISDQATHFYLAVSGPTDLQSHWHKRLAPGESFTSVPVAVGVSDDNVEHAAAQLTRYRRLIRRNNKDNATLPVIFNDYMNCLFGDPTTAKELPLIDRAAACGCEYYVIDCGWYDKGNWWDTVGEWRESRERFPHGIKEVTEYIRRKGMVPGCWLELEVMGIHSPMVEKADEDWFFHRYGERVYDRSRYQLDFRNMQVRHFATGVVDRLVQDYGFGYIKMDYNIEPGAGTETMADSLGDGLLEHERAYLGWLDDIQNRYPDLVIENCASGGLRMDYALLSRLSIQSTSDQQDYRNYASIAANAAIGVTPEQAGVWSYPMVWPEELLVEEKEETIYNMVNAMLCRIQQSGQIAQLSEERLALVAEGIRCYKKIRKDIPRSVPFWPLGLADITDQWIVAGIQTQESAYLAVWKRTMKGKKDNRRMTADKMADQGYWEIPLSSSEELGKYQKAALIYPVSAPIPYALEQGVLKLYMDKPVMARLFRLER